MVFQSRPSKQGAEFKKKMQDKSQNIKTKRQIITTRTNIHKSKQLYSSIAAYPWPVSTIFIICLLLLYSMLFPSCKLCLPCSFLRKGTMQKLWERSSSLSRSFRTCRPQEAPWLTTLPLQSSSKISLVSISAPAVGSLQSMSGGISFGKF